jgi:hypothetical protein
LAEELEGGNERRQGEWKVTEAKYQDMRVVNDVDLDLGDITNEES